MEFRSHTLPNGLEIVAECNPDALTAAVGFFVKTGARDETPEVAGVSHFLEHMVFKGTPTRSAEDVNREFDEMGAQYNAFTGDEQTVYYAAVLPECQLRATALLGDIMRPSLRDDDFTTEKQVILEEIQMYEDQPPFCADDKCKAIYFQRHPLAHSVLGSIASVSELRVDQMRSYFERRYSPANITLAAAGRVDFPQLVAQVEKSCGAWRRFETGREAARAAGHDEFRCLVKDSATQQYAVRFSAGPAAHDADRYAAKLLATVVGDDGGSRLFWTLVDPGLAESATLGHYEYEDAGVMVAFLTCDPDHAAGNLQTMHDLFRDVETNGITQTELDQAKCKVNSRVVLGSERPYRRLFNVGINWIQRREYRTVKDDLDAVDRITLADIRGVLDRYPLTRATTITIGPLADVPAPK